MCEGSIDKGKGHQIEEPITKKTFGFPKLTVTVTVLAKLLRQQFLVCQIGCDGKFSGWSFGKVSTWTL